MLRCKACDARLSKFTLTTYKEGTKDIEDLCPACKHVAKSPEILDTSDYAYAHITENWKNFRSYEENS
jgi:hypothetical protein